MSRKNYLFLAALLIVGLFFSLPIYYNWFFRFILHPGFSYASQFQHLNAEERRYARYGQSYAAYMQWVAAFKQRNILDPVILFPPAGYFKKSVSFDIETVEPSMFYYFTGYKAAIATSPYVDKATWTVVPGRNGPMLKRIESREEREALVKTYLQFKPDQ